MGRHSSPEQLPYYRSVAVWFAPWVLIGAVALAALYIALTSLVSHGAPSHDNKAAVATPSFSSPVVTETPKPSATPHKTKRPASPKPAPTKKAPTKKAPPKLITAGISVQVLNATGVTNAGQDMADKLASKGYEIVAVETAFGHYTHTTVYWSNEAAKPAAQALAGRYGWESGPKPANLSASVDVHVVVGDDAATG